MVWVVLVFKATFNIISVISWRLLVTLIKGEVFTVFLQGRLIKRVDLMSICHEIKKKNSLIKIRIYSRDQQSK
jgi:hypothetical protein